MGKRIKRRFILLTVLALAATLLLTFGSVFALLRHSATRDADRLIQLIAQNGGRMPHSGFVEYGMNSETPYSTRYYVVWTDASGSFQAANMDNIALDTAAQISGQVRDIFSSGKAKGYSGDARYGVFASSRYPGGYAVVVVDWADSLRMLRILGSMMAVTAAVVLVVVLVLLLWLSRYAVRPFERNQEKQRQFITDAGHELKTPLAIISSNAEVLEMTSGSSKWLDNIKNQTQRINQLVGSMMALSRMDEEKLEEESRQELDLSEILEETVQAFSAAARTRGLDIQTAIEPGVRITGYLEDMNRLAGILLDNAVKYTDDRGYLRVALMKKGRRAVLTVENSCAGMDRQQLPRLFDRFYRADSSRSRDTGGYGIGLSMAQMLVRRQKGKLSVDYTEQEIIRFTAEV